MHKFGLALAISLLVSGCLSPQIVMSDSGTGQPKSMVYSQGATMKGVMDLELDYYAGGKTCTQARPVLLFVHGGGFKGGDRSRGSQVSRAYAAEGFNAFSIDYRKLNDRPRPTGAYARLATMIQPRETEPGMSNAVAAALQDTVSALRFIRDNATRFCSDPSKVVLYGRSAGAITVLNVAYMLDDAGISRPPIAGVISSAGGKVPAGALGSKDVPVFLMHGEQDQTVPFSEAEAIWAQAQATGTPAHFHAFANRGHGLPPTRLSVKGTSLLDLSLTFAQDAVEGGVKGSVRTRN